MKNPFKYWNPAVAAAHNARVAAGAAPEPDTATHGKRVKQRTKPLTNKLESEWFAIISSQFPNYPRPRAQAKRYLLANGVTYTPDFTAASWPHPMRESRETAWEVKGPKAWDDAIVKLKMAASAWPEVCWILVWKEKGTWREQEILP